MRATSPSNGSSAGRRSFRTPASSSRICRLHATTTSTSASPKRRCRRTAPAPASTSGRRTNAHRPDLPQVLDRMVEEFPDQYAFRYTTLDYTRTYSGVPRRRGHLRPLAHRAGRAAGRQRRHMGHQRAAVVHHLLGDTRRSARCWSRSIPPIRSTRPSTCCASPTPIRSS
jgi:hypothetical protein